MEETIGVRAELLMTLGSKQDWINKIPRHLPAKEYYGEEFLFLDKNGNILTMGKDFSEAKKQETYPVKIYRLITVSMANKD